MTFLEGVSSVSDYSTPTTVRQNTNLLSSSTSKKLLQKTHLRRFHRRRPVTTKDTGFHLATAEVGQKPDVQPLGELGTGFHGSVTRLSGV